jgi:copper resistance protein D
VTETGLIAGRFVHYMALSLAFGSFAYGAFADSGAPATLGGRLRSLALWSSLGVLSGAAAVLLATVAGMGGGYAATADGSLWSAIIEETDFGRVWIVRLWLASALLVVASAAWRWPSAGLRMLGLVLAGGLLVTVALTGHAQIESGLAGLLHRAADAIHLLAAATWIGALLPLLLLMARSAPGQVVERPEAVARRLQGFHALGLTAVLLLLATGLINSWFLVGNVNGLVTTPYGWVLLVKFSFFAAMVGMAADNRLRLVPQLNRELAAGRDPQSVLQRLRGHVRGELILGIIVLLAVAVLGVMAPAHDAVFAGE